MSYLIKNGQLVAVTSEELKSGSVVTVSKFLVENKLNENRDFDLVNAITCKVSNAKKWERFENESYFARAINNSDNEFELI